MLQSARLCCLQVLRCAEKFLHLQRTRQDVLDLVQAALEQGHREFRPLFDGALHFGSDHICLVFDPILESKRMVSEDLSQPDAFPEGPGVVLKVKSLQIRLIGREFLVLILVIDHVD